MRMMNLGDRQPQGLRREGRGQVADVADAGTQDFRMLRAREEDDRDPVSLLSERVQRLQGRRSALKDREGVARD